MDIVSIHRVSTDQYDFAYQNKILVCTRGYERLTKTEDTWFYEGDYVPEIIEDWLREYVPVIHTFIDCGHKFQDSIDLRVLCIQKQDLEVPSIETCFCRYGIAMPVTALKLYNLGRRLLSA